jgi:site-specific recombinase XerD
MSEQNPTFSELTTAYINSKKGKDKADKTFSGYRNSLQRLEWFLRAKDISYTDIDKETDIAVEIDDPEDDIQPSKIDDNNLLDYFLLWLLHEEQYATSTVQTTFNFVQPFIRFLKNEEHISYNATDDIQLSNYLTYGETAQGKRWNEDYVAVSPEQFETMLEHCPAPRFRNRLMLSLMFGCGLRRAEVAALELDHIILEKNRIDIPAVKTDEGRAVWFEPDESIHTNLNIWINGKRSAYYNADSSDKLFVTNDSRSQDGITPKRVSKIVREAADHLDGQDYIEDKNGVEKAKYTAHSLRHGFAEEFIQSAGESGIYELKELMGHSSVSVTERYTSSDKDEFLSSQMQRHGPEI